MAQAEVHSRQISNDDEVFLSRFEDCTLPASAWTHFAHIRIAWLYLAQDDPDTALKRICGEILRYNTEVLLRRHKYHETVTVAFARIVSDRMQALQTWQQFADGIDDILDPATPVLMTYYSGEPLFSDEARQNFVEPDIRHLPVFRVF